MTTIDVLTNARERVARGWCQGSKEYMKPEAVFVCAQGAIWRALSPAVYPKFGPAFVRFLQIVESMETVIRSRLPSWNDDPRRTQAEVLAVFDRVIAVAKAAQP